MERNRRTARRAPMVGDCMVIDYPELNAIVFVDDISEDPSMTNGMGLPGRPAYHMKYLVGVGTHGDGGAFDVNGSIWLIDDPQNMSIVGVNGYRLPPTFYGADVIGVLRDHGAIIDYI